jgi:sugar phosphate isomerase/epimerase
MQPTATTAHDVAAAQASVVSRAPRLSMSEMTTYRWSFLEDVSSYPGAGLSALGVWRQKLEEFGEERGIELLRESQLEVSSLSCAGGFTGSDGLSFREALDDALDQVSIAGALQAETLVVVSGGRAGHTGNHARRLLRDALTELGDAAAGVRLQIAVQPLHSQLGSRWSFLHSIEPTLEVLDRCDHPHVGMAFDVSQFWREAELCRKISLASPWIRLVQINDCRGAMRGDGNDHCLPGRGMVPLVDILAALQQSGYAGYYEVQIQSDECWRADYPTLIKECCESLLPLWMLAHRSHTAVSPVASHLPGLQPAASAGSVCVPGATPTV